VPSLSWKLSSEKEGANAATATLLFLMALSLSLDMGGEYGLRAIALITVFPALVFLTLFSGKFRFLTAFAILIVWPTFCFWRGVQNGAAVGLALSQLSSTIFGFLLYQIVSWLPVATAATALYRALIVAALTSICLSVGLLAGSDLVFELTRYLELSGGGYFGLRDLSQSALVPNVYFKSSLFYLWAFTFGVFMNRRVGPLIAFGGMLAAISKASILGAVIVVIVRAASTSSARGLLLAFTCLLGMGAFIKIASLDAVVWQLLTLESYTVEVRLLHFTSLIDYWSNNVDEFIFGSGLGTGFYSAGESAIVTNIELDHLNVVRKYGLIWALIFFLWIFRTAYTAVKSDDPVRRGTGWALFAVFVVAGTNPVLISPLLFFSLGVASARVKKVA
jgi:hypothetical protein